MRIGTVIAAAAALLLIGLWAYGVTTACPDLKIYVYCPENLR